jgi:O-antigen ligase
MKITLEKVLLFFMCAFLIVLPGFPQLGAIGLGLSLVVASIINIRNHTFSGFSRNLILLGTFYVLHLIGIIYSANTNFALLDIQIKASFLLIPFCFDKKVFQQIEINFVKQALVVGCFGYSVYLLIAAFLNFQSNHQVSTFFYTEFSPKQHVAYLTMYIILACIFIIQHLQEKQSLNNVSKFVSCALLLFFYVIIAMLSSRTAIFSGLITLSIFIFFSLKSKFDIVKSVLFSGINAVVFVFVFWFITGSQNRFEKPIPASTNTTAEQKSAEESSTVQRNVRYTLWSTAVTIFKEHPLLGVGTGDIKDELLLKYKQQNFQEGITYNLNAHNQFFQTLATLGIPGIISLLLLFLVPIIHAIKKGNVTFMAFSILIIINCLTESVFEKQAGVLFFCFFFILLQQPKFDGMLNK